MFMTIVDEIAVFLYAELASVCLLIQSQDQRLFEAICQYDFTSDEKDS